MCNPCFSVTEAGIIVWGLKKMNPNFPAQAQNAPPPIDKWKVLISVMFGIFMIIIDSTVVNVAFQTLRREFGGTLADSQWVLSIYVLALGITTPISGFLGDRFGTKTMYLLGLSMFLIGSFACGLAPSLPFLIAARAFQGIGGGLAQPLGPAMLYRAFPMNEIGKALGIFGISLSVGPALGPILGGLLVDANLWRYIFFINIPIGIVGIAMGMRYLPNVKTPKVPKFDPLGLGLSIIGFGSMLYAATTAEANGWTSGPTLTYFGIGLVALTAFAIVELFVVKEPMLNLRMFTIRNYTNATFVGYIATVALFGAEFLMPIYLQAFRGRTALEAGTILLAVAAGSIITNPIAGRLYDKIGPRLIVVTGFALLMLNTYQLAQIGPLTPINNIMGLLFIRGLGVGLALQTTFTTALGSVPRAEVTRGSSLQNSTRFVVQAVAVAALATVLSSNISPEVRNQRTQPREVTSNGSTERFGICETPGVANEDNVPAAAANLPAPAKAQARAAVQKACDENIVGFEATYRVTFFASIAALLVALFLPGWPGKWDGRAGLQGTARPVVGGGH